MTLNAGVGDPPLAPTQRDLNRLAVIDLVFSEPGIVRSAVQERTGLSRATIFRIIDELTTEGFVSETPASGARTRGRPKLELSISPTNGMVLGADIGVLTTRMMLCDLNGVVLARSRTSTPRDLSAKSLARWVEQQAESLAREASDHGLVVRAVVSLPARVDADGAISRPSGHLSRLAGSTFRELLAEALTAPTELRSDPDMALLGEMQIGRAVGFNDVAMFVISSSVSASIAVDGRMLAGRRKVIGEFGSMPLDAQRVLADVLTVPGILKFASTHGVQAVDVASLLSGADAQTLVLIRGGVVEGLVTAFSAVILSVDPEVIVVTGSLIPLISDVLPEVVARLDELLPSVPRVALSETGGFSQPRGAVEVALADARDEIRRRVLIGPLRTS